VAWPDPDRRRATNFIDLSGDLVTPAGTKFVSQNVDI
jgi:hypothetical protein